MLVSGLCSRPIPPPPQAPFCPLNDRAPRRETLGDTTQRRCLPDLITRTQKRGEEGSWEIRKSVITPASSQNAELTDFFGTPRLHAAAPSPRARGCGMAPLLVHAATSCFKPRDVVPAFFTSSGGASDVMGIFGALTLFEFLVERARLV